MIKKYSETMEGIIALEIIVTPFGVDYKHSPKFLTQMSFGFTNDIYA